MRSKSTAILAILVCSLFMLAVFISCGNSNFFPSSTAIVAITISPTDAGVQLSAATEQFSAQGTFGNGNTGDVTGDVNWSSSSPAVATISQAGLATAVASGTTTITAKSSSTSATTSLTVLNVTSITITGGTSLAASGSEQLTAVDQDSNNITNFVTWNSDNTDLVTVSSTGVASAQSLSVGGTANITATLPGASGNTITSNTLSISVSAT